MRVTNGMMIANMMRNISRNQMAMDKTQQSMATGKKFLNPSDDPIGVSRSLRLHTDVATMEQYKRNVDDASSWMNTTELATNNIIDILQRARELTVQAANGSNSVDERNAVASEIKQLREQLINVGNSTYAGRYIFSGYKTDKPLLKSDGTYDLGGGSLNNNESINFNIGVGDTLGVNILGQRVFGYMVEDGDLDKDISTGMVDHIVKADAAATGTGDNTLNFNYDGMGYTVTIPAGPYSDTDAINAAINSSIDAIPELKGHIKFGIEDGKVNIISDKPFTLSATAMTTALGYTTNMPKTAVKATNALEGAVVDLSAAGFTVDGTSNKFIINYNGTDCTLTLDAATYDNSPLTLDNFVEDLQEKINGDATLKNHVTVKNDNNRIIISSDGTVALKNISPTASFDVGSMGMLNGKASSSLDNKVDSGAKTQLIGVFDQLISDLTSDNAEGISAALGRMDKQINNINALRAEIGVKSNRIDLTANRIADDTINLNDLLSKNEDADMAEVIMNLTAQENVYKASLSAGARIIQPSLIDFLR